MIHIRGLNGLRAICAIYVLFSHVEQELVFVYGGNMNVFTASAFAVTVFFTISGFLITHQLLFERQSLGVISIRNFYLRRCLRIIPLYFFYIFLAIVVVELYSKKFNFEYLTYFILPLANIPFIQQIQVPLLGHLWSIGVEEQFYLFWPWVIRSVNKIGYFVFGFIMAFLCLKIFIWISVYSWNNKFLYAMHITRFDCIAIGCLGALLFQKKGRRIGALFLSPFIQLVTYSAVLVLVFGKFHVADVIDHEVVAVLSVVIIFCIHYYKRSLINLQSRWIDYLGSISYGLYMYHPLIIFLIFELVRKFFHSRVVAIDILVYLSVTGVTIGIAGLSYKYFERQFLLKKALK